MTAASHDRRGHGRAEQDEQGDRRREMGRRVVAAVAADRAGRGEHDEPERLGGEHAEVDRQHPADRRPQTRAAHAERRTRQALGATAGEQDDHGENDEIGDDQGGGAGGVGRVVAAGGEDEPAGGELAGDQGDRDRRDGGGWAPACDAASWQ
jgi:hypothetical protein